MEHLRTQMMMLLCFRLTEEVNGLMNEQNNFFKQCPSNIPEQNNVVLILSFRVILPHNSPLLPSLLKSKVCTDFPLDKSLKSLYQFNENPQNSISTKKLKRGKFSLLFSKQHCRLIEYWENETTKIYRNRNINSNFPKNALNYYLVLFSKATSVNIMNIECVSQSL